MIKEIHSLNQAIAHLRTNGSLSGVAVQEVDFSETDGVFTDADVSNSFFLGCTLNPRMVQRVQEGGGYVFVSPPDYPFRPFRSTLYSPEELYDVFDPAEPCSYCDCTDANIYRHWNDTGRDHVTSIVDAMFRGIHDRSVYDALNDFLDASGRDVVAIMGGHSLLRTDTAYREIAEVSRTLARQGFLMVSGGGPGAMEATHLGAMLAEAEDGELDRAIGGLAEAPSYRDRGWLSAAVSYKNALLERRVALSESLGIPTWLYGHEPPTPFASHIAKFFNNSIREEGLITVAHAGIIFAPGSAGTVQELFQDAAQNHYATTGYASPMVFMGRKYWTETIPVWPVLQAMSPGRPYAANLHLADGVADTVSLFCSVEKIPVDGVHWDFCKAYCDEDQN